MSASEFSSTDASSPPPPPPPPPRTRRRVTAPTVSESPGSTLRSTSAANAFLRVATPVRRFILSHCENSDLVALYVASRGSAAAVVDHLRTTPSVAFETPPQVECTPLQTSSSSSSSPSASSLSPFMAKFASLLPLQYPSRHARLVVRALWAEPDTPVDDRTNKASSICHSRVALAHYVADRTQCARVVELTVDRHAVSDTLLHWVASKCVNLERLHLLDGARCVSTTRTIAFPNAYNGYGLDPYREIGTCLLQRAPTLRALTLELTDVPFGSENIAATAATAASFSLDYCRSLSVTLTRVLAAARHLVEFRLDAASTALLPFAATDDLVEFINAQHVPRNGDDGDEETAVGADDGVNDVTVPLRLLQLRFLYSDQRSQFERRLSAQLAMSAQHLREVDIEVAVGVQLNDIVQTDAGGRTYRVPPLADIVQLPCLTRLRLWALDQHAPIDAWRVRIDAPQLETLRCNVMSATYLDFVLEHRATIACARSRTRCQETTMRSRLRATTPGALRRTWRGRPNLSPKIRSPGVLWVCARSSA